MPVPAAPSAPASPPGCPGPPRGECSTPSPPRAVALLRVEAPWPPHGSDPSPRAPPNPVWSGSPSPSPLFPLRATLSWKTTPASYWSHFLTPPAPGSIQQQPERSSLEQTQTQELTPLTHSPWILFHCPQHETRLPLGLPFLNLAPTLTPATLHLQPFHRSAFRPERLALWPILLLGFRVTWEVPSVTPSSFRPV